MHRAVDEHTRPLSVVVIFLVVVVDEVVGLHERTQGTRQPVYIPSFLFRKQMQKHKNEKNENFVSATSNLKTKNEYYLLFCRFVLIFWNKKEKDGIYTDPCAYCSRVG